MINRRLLRKLALAFYAVVPALTACGASPNSFTGTASQPLAITTQRVDNESWMLPEAKNEDLLYVADSGTGGVVVYSYNPPRYKFVGLLHGAPEALNECVDKNQDLFVTNGGSGNGRVTVAYKHGEKNPFRILGDPGGLPTSCSIDPTNGNLAVTGYRLEQPPSVAIYAGAKGRPVLYSDSDFNYIFYCSYDDSGNLYVDGGDSKNNNFMLAELPAGSSTFVNIKVKQPIVYSGAVRWDGKYLDVGDGFKGIIYRFKIKGHVAKEISSIQLGGTENVVQFFTTGSRLISPSGDVQSRSGWVAFYKYPAGGELSRNLPNFSDPTGVVISRAAK